MKTAYYYAGGQIMTHGLDIGPRVYMHHRAGPYEVWHAPAHKYWAGLYRPWATALSTYYLVRVQRRGRGGVAQVLLEARPGYSWHPVRAELRDMADRACRAQEATRRPVVSSIDGDT